MSMERYQGGMITVAPEVMREVVAGNIAGLTAAQQTEYMLAVCSSLGLNPLVKPMEFISFPSRRGEPAKTVLYPGVTAINMLIDRHTLSIDYSDVHEEPERDIMIQWCYVTDGRRTGKDFGALPMSREEWQYQNGKNVRTGRKLPLEGEAWANQKMKLVTKARRRAVLAFCGLPSVFGGSDQDASDADDAIAGESRIVDMTTGEVTAGDALPVLEATNAPGTPELSGPGLPLYEVEAQPPTAQSQPDETHEQPKEPWPVRLVRKYSEPPYHLSEADCLAILGVESWDEWAKNGGTATGANSALADYFAGSVEEADPEPETEAAKGPDPAGPSQAEAEEVLEDRVWEEFKYTRQDIFNALSAATGTVITSWAAWSTLGFTLAYAYQMIAADYREANRTEAEKNLDSIFPPAGEDGHPSSAAEVISDVLETQDDLPF